MTVTPDPMTEIRTTFFQECEEQLAALEDGLMAMEAGELSSETVNAVFRSVHSIKGGAGAFQLLALVEFAHAFESVLDLVRNLSLAADAEVIGLLLKSADILSDLVKTFRDGQEVNPDTYAQVLAELSNIAGEDPQSAEDEFTSLGFVPSPILIDEPSLGPEARGYKITFKPHARMLRSGNDPIAIIRELGTLGTVDAECKLTSTPELRAFDPAESYFSFEINLLSDADRDTVEKVFEFVHGDCELDIHALAESGQCETPAPIVTVLETHPSEPAPQHSTESDPPARVEEAASKTEVTTFRQQAEDTHASQPNSAQTIRVDLERIDRLINLVGELVINQAMLSSSVAQSSDGKAPKVAESLQDLERLTRDIQDSVMTIRAQPAKTLFQRMARIMREVASNTGKVVRLKVDGESAEIDKTVIDLLADPLTHMIRNAVDHGLEPTEDRIATGKPAEGTVRLSAAHRSGRVLITVSDDGAGINRRRVLDIARNKKLVSADAQLSDAEVDNLLFLPGFSTAATVSNISGRGVGMDVVKRSIQSLGGRISISSTPGQGTTFALSLPLTLAVLDGIVVAIADQTFVIPITSIVETVKLDKASCEDFGQSSQVMKIRGRFIPVVDLGQSLGARTWRAAMEGRIAVITETADNLQCALIVDEILSQRQVVIKSLEQNYGAIRGIAAATILGDGRVAMIVDVDAIVHDASGIRTDDASKKALAS